MHLVQAVISGQESDRSRAHAHRAETKRIGEQLGSATTSRPSSVPPTCSCTLSRLPSTSETQARRSTLPAASTHRVSSPERQARLLVDVARAYGQRRHTGEATKALLDAECLAPEDVRSHHLTHSMIRDLIDRLGRRAPTDLVELARRSAAMP